MRADCYNNVTWTPPVSISPKVGALFIGRQTEISHNYFVNTDGALTTAKIVILHGTTKGNSSAARFIFSASTPHEGESMLYVEAPNGRIREVLECLDSLQVEMWQQAAGANAAGAIGIGG